MISSAYVEFFDVVYIIDEFYKTTVLVVALI